MRWLKAAGPFLASLSLFGGSYWLGKEAAGGWERDVVQGNSAGGEPTL